MIPAAAGADCLPPRRCRSRVDGMSDCRAELCAYWPGEGCMRAVMPCDEELAAAEWPVLPPGVTARTVSVITETWHDPGYQGRLKR